jgi:hypothetical protein
MSVIPHDATGSGSLSPDSPLSPELMPPVENAVRLDHLLVDINAIALPGEDHILTPAETAETAAFHQATIALNVSDVVDLGTESVAGIDALIIHGEQGDTVHLANEAGYLWSHADGPAAPDGYDIYQASAIPDHDVALSGILAEHTQPVYVLIQHDLTVILGSA